jgi:hypothetical protein
VLSLNSYRPGRDIIGRDSVRLLCGRSAAGARAGVERGALIRGAVGVERG